MNFQKSSERPLTPSPALILENYVALFSEVILFSEINDQIAVWQKSGHYLSDFPQMARYPRA